MVQDGAGYGEPAEVRICLSNEFHVPINILLSKNTVEFALNDRSLEERFRRLTNSSIDFLLRRHFQVRSQFNS